MAEFVDRRKGQAPVNSRADRACSFQIKDFPFPHGREEDWRFTPLNRMNDLLEEKLSGTPIKVSYQNQELSYEKNRKIELAGGSHIGLHVDQCAKLGTVGKPGDRAAVVAWNNYQEILHIDIAEKWQANEPIIVDLTARDENPTAQHIVIEAGTLSESVVVLNHSGKGRLNQTVEVVVHDDAQLNLVSIQDWDYDAVHLSNHRMQVGANAKLKHIVVTLGGDLVRICPDVEYSGEGGDAELLGIYFTDTKQHHEHRLFVNHGIRNCISNVNYKGAIHGQESHAVWIGDVLIGAEAFGTDSYEQNRNLILNSGAKADSVPNLEIENGDIAGAGHASATGRFDDEQLFYLRSRGIPEDEARKLVVNGFFAELIHQIGIADIEERLMQAIEKELEKGPAPL